MSRNVPWQEFVDAIDRVIRNTFDGVVQIGLGIEAVQACCADQAIHRSGTFSARVRANEQVIATAQRDTSQRSLRDQVVDFRTPIATVEDERRQRFSAY